jgi:Flp pilus assembly protein TadG
MALRRFLQNRDGGVGPMLALAAIPLFGFVGAAVDFSRAASVRTAMQTALDATALMLSKDAQTLSGAQLEQKATLYFNSNFSRPEAQNVQITQQFTAPAVGSFTLKVSGSGTIQTVFTKLLGQSQISFSASAEVTWGMKKLNLALALDNTGSMASSGKMTQLKVAAHNLLNTLQAAAKQPDDVKVSIIPFAVGVNVGTGNAGASWISWSDWDDENGTCSSTSYTTKSDCLSHGKTWTPKSHTTYWNGCVNDRDQNNDVTATPTGSGSSTKYRAQQLPNCPVSMMTLTNDWTGLHSKIDAMTPTGNTNVTIGLQMAWMTVSPNAPFYAPAEADDLEKVIILLTDGQNTQNRWSTTQSSIDARTQKVCDNLKATNIKVYTIRVIDGNATLLKNCATKPSMMYYDVDAAIELNTVFGAIAQTLANLRISK